MYSKRSIIKRRVLPSSALSTTPFSPIKFILFFAAVLLALAVVPIEKVAATAGDLDLTFGSGGKVTTDFRPGVPDQVMGLALQPDGKIVAAGITGWQPFFGSTTPGMFLADVAIARYKSDGSIDASFGSGGRVTTDFFGFRDMALAIKLQPDGKILIGGLASHPPFDDDFALARYNSDGSLDTSFGVGGKVTTDFGGEHDGINSLILLPSGKIVAVGVSWREGSEDDFALAGYNPNGSLDTSFGSEGKVVVDLGRNVDDIGIGSALSDGKIVVAGSTNSTLFDSGRFGPDVFGEGDFAVARFDLNGSLDTTFGSGGIVVTDIFGEDIAVTVAAQPDGKIIAAGMKSSLTQDFALVRYNSNGSLDGTFGSGGKVSTDISGHDIAFSLILQPNGKIVATGIAGLTEIPVGTDGYVPEVPHAQFGLARFNTNGSLDPTFGVDGKLMTDFVGLNGFACSSAQQNDGKLIVGGTAYISDTDSVFALARYTLRSKQAIAFTSSRDGNTEIYIMNPDGTNQTRLTNNFADDTQPSLSSDGTRIAFMSTRDGNEEIYVMNSDGSGQMRLTNNVFSDRYPVFSYDGTRIVFSSFRDGNQEIYLMNSDGSGQTRLTDNAASDDQPAFSPDGSGIVFESWRDQNCELYLMNTSGGGLTRLTFVAPFLDEHPEYSPNGGKIVFFSGRDGYPEIYLMNPDGSGQTRLTNAPGFDDYPTFSPNGSQIAFRSDRDGNSEIYSMNADGSGQTRLTYVPGEDSMPSWGGDQAVPSVTVSGKVLTAYGLPLRNATVSLIDPQNVRRISTTSSFGIYSFSNVRLAETYIISVASKRYRFAPRIMQFTSSLSDLDFVGME